MQIEKEFNGTKFIIVIDDNGTWKETIRSKNNVDLRAKAPKKSLGFFRDEE